jgi:hypothetical protein
MSRGAWWPALLVFLLAGCFTNAASDGGLGQARDAARAVAQAEDGSAASAQSGSLHGTGARTASLPQLSVGQTWTGTVTSPTSRVALQWRVAAVGELLNVSNQMVATDRLALTAGAMAGTEWLRQADLAILKISWDLTQDQAQPYPPGLVTVFTPPCALHWPANSGESWTSECQVRSWMQQSPTQVSSANQTVRWNVALGDDGVLRATGEGMLMPEGQPDANQHFTQVLSLGSSCDPLGFERFDDQGDSESIFSKDCGTWSG